MALLEIDGIEVLYGRVRGLQGVTMAGEEGEVVTLIGSNGAGKPTTLRAISGLVPIAAGTIRLGGRELKGLSAPKIVELGVGHAPEGRHICPRMTVRDNLELGAYLRRDRAEIRADMTRVFELFPRLAERSSQ